MHGLPRGDDATRTAGAPSAGGELSGDLDFKFDVRQPARNRGDSISYEFKFCHF